MVTGISHSALGDDIQGWDTCDQGSVASEDPSRPNCCLFLGLLPREAQESPSNGQVNEWDGGTQAPGVPKAT